MKGTEKKRNWFLDHYERPIAAIVVVALLGSLAFLAISSGVIRTMQDDFDSALKGMDPAHPVAKLLDETQFQGALATIGQPLPQPLSLPMMFVPEERALCLECNRPISFQGMRERLPCPFCGSTGPKIPVKKDKDGDGIPNAWEVRYGMDENDPKDAELDRDGDGFSNLEEFNADTVPTNSASAPLSIAVRLVEIKAEPFPLVLSSALTLPGGSYKFVLNTPDGMSHFRKMDEDIFGYKITKFEKKSVKRRQGGMMRTVDLSELTLVKGDTLVKLIRNQRSSEKRADIELVDDRKQLSLSEGATITVRGKVYELMELNDGAQSLLLRRQGEAAEWTIARASRPSASAKARPEITDFVPKPAERPKARPKPATGPAHTPGKVETPEDVMKKLFPGMQ